MPTVKAGPWTISFDAERAPYVTTRAIRAVVRQGPSCLIGQTINVDELLYLELFKGIIGTCLNTKPLTYNIHAVYKRKWRSDRLCKE